MWKIKMKVILIKDKCYKGISEDWYEETTDTQKWDMKEMALSEITIRLADDVARQVVNHSEPKALWDALEIICLTKSLSSSIHYFVGCSLLKWILTSV
ncbi:hypothetical protein LINPERPRIM_LOCUS2609, partial [Linum perenne]